MSLPYIQRIFTGNPSSSAQIIRQLSIGKSVRSSTNIENEPERPASFVDDELEAEAKKPINTNKSRLSPQHRNMLHGKVPYDKPLAWFHLTEKYQRKMYGLYGNTSGVNPRICFPTEKYINEQTEYEKVAYPFTLQEMMQKSRQEEEQKLLEIQKREEQIAAKLEKLDQWKADLNAKIAKKEAEARAAKEKKERLVEEVRRHFGFTIDPRDERFKELLEQKEKESKKKEKEAKRKAKEDKMMAKLVETTAKKSENKEHVAGSKDSDN